jgi:hypothetical protein
MFPAAFRIHKNKPMQTQKFTLFPILRAFCLFLCLLHLPLISPLQAQVFEESYFSERYPKRNGQIKGFVKSDKTLLIHATAPSKSQFSTEYLALINADGQTLWNTFDWPQTAASVAYSNLTLGSNDAIYLSTIEDGLYFLLKISATTGAIQWKKPYLSGVSIWRIVERSPDELVVLEYDNNTWIRFYAISDGQKIKEIGLSGLPAMLAADLQGDLYYSKSDSIFKLKGTSPSQYLWRSSAELPLNSWTENWSQAYLPPGGNTMTILGKNTADYGIYAHLNTQTGQANEIHQNYTNEGLRDWVVVGDTLYSCWQHAYVGGGSYSFSLVASRVSDGQFVYQQFYQITNPANGLPLYGAAGSLSLDADADGFLYLTGYANTANYDPGAWGLVKIQRADGTKIWDKVVDDTPGGYDALSTGRIVWIPENGKLWVAGELQQDENTSKPILTELDPSTGNRLNTIDLAGNYQFPSATMQFIMDANGYSALKQVDNRVQVARFDNNGQPQWETSFSQDLLLEVHGMYAGKGNTLIVPALHRYSHYFTPYEYRFDSLHLYRINGTNGQMIQSLRFAGQGQTTNPLFVSAQTDTMMLVYHEYDNVKLARFVGTQQIPPVVLRSGVFDAGAFLAPHHLFVEQGRKLIYLQSLNQYQICTPTGNQAYNIPPVPVFMNAATALTGSTEIVAAGTQNTNLGWGIFRWLPGSDVAVWSKTGNTGTIDRVISTTDNFLYTYGIKSYQLFVKKFNATTGALLWEKTITSSVDIPELNSMSWNPVAGQLILGGALVKNNGQRRVWLVKIDGNGNVTAQTERNGDFVSPENRILATGTVGAKFCLGGQMIKAGLGRAGFIWLQEGDFYSVSGKVYYDRNNNLQHDFPEPVWRQTVSLSPGNYVSFPDSAGFYQFFVPQAGAYQCRVADFSPHITVDPADFTLNTTQANLIGQDIRLWSAVQVQDVALELMDLRGPRFGSVASLAVSVQNLGTEQVDSVQLSLDCGTSFTFKGLDPVAGLRDSVLSLDLSGNTLHATLSGLEFVQRQDWIAYGLLNTFLLPGDTLRCRAEVTTFPSMDVALQNNTDSLYWLITGAYDPNDITVTPGPLVNKSRLLPDGSLDLLYRIRFENTGNAPTDFIRLETQLHPLLKPETFRLGAASAPCTVHFLEDRRVEIVFPDYHLVPAMADSAAAQGFVFFQIHTAPGLNIGDQCTQQAAIYFDYNPPIYTNQASVTITNPSAVQNPEQKAGAGLEIYPNPAHSGQTVWIKNPENFGKYQLSDLTGRILLRGNAAHGVELRGIPAGVYLLESGGRRCWLMVD